jgi:hypothetical protein
MCPSFQTGQEMRPSPSTIKSHDGARNSTANTPNKVKIISEKRAVSLDRLEKDFTCSKRFRLNCSGNGIIAPSFVNATG